ncbi:MAG: 6-phosphogluconolactonase [Thermoguttaceae bacterium]
MFTLVICDDSDVLARKAADLIVQAAQEAFDARGMFKLALSGGFTPQKTFALLALPDRRSAIDWSKTYIFFSDERFVPARDPRSNFRMAEEALLAQIEIPVSNVFPLSSECDCAAEAAKDYENKLLSFFAKSGEIAQPRFDLILLGLGDDGHTASLFPNSPALCVEESYVTSSKPGKSPPAVDRVTFTLPLLNAAKHILFLVSGANKASALHATLQGDAGSDCPPAAAVRPTNGIVTWIVDKDAAKFLDPNLGNRENDNQFDTSAAKSCSPSLDERITRKPFLLPDRSSAEQ